MSDLRKAAADALALLEAKDFQLMTDIIAYDEAKTKAILALRAALAEDEQSEPCIYLDPDTGETWTMGAIQDGCRPVDGLIALYATPSRREPLSYEELLEMWMDGRVPALNFAREIEARHGITGEKT